MSASGFDELSEMLTDFSHEATEKSKRLRDEALDIGNQLMRYMLMNYMHSFENGNGCDGLETEFLDFIGDLLEVIKRCNEIIENETIASFEEQWEELNLWGGDA